MIKYVALLSLFAKALMASVLMLLAIFRWKNFEASGQFFMLWLAASTYAHARYLLPFFLLFSPFFFLLEILLLSTQRQ